MTYTGAITFYDLLLGTNGYITMAYRATTTEFSLATTSPSLVITNTAISRGSLSFEILSATGEATVVETRTNLVAGQWETLVDHQQSRWPGSGHLSGVSGPTQCFLSSSQGELLVEFRPDSTQQLPLPDS